jgi:hypothetical protein
MTYFLKTTGNKFHNWICSCGRKNDADVLVCVFCANGKEEKRTKEKTCSECGKKFVPVSHGMVNKFCSNSCSAKHQWKTRPKAVVKFEVKKCDVCHRDFLRNKNYSDNQWAKAKFCSSKCAASLIKINDGMDRSERYRRKNGMIKSGSQEWIAKLKETTKIGMASPEVKVKLHNPKGPMSDERKSIISRKLTGFMPKNLIGGNGSYPNVQRGDYECSKGSVYFRSKWEANYALYLDMLLKTDEILNWEYEADVFVFEEIKFGSRSYRPDFKVFKTDSIEYHEVKGYMDSRSKTKLKRMEKYYPEVNLKLIQRDQYQSILKSLKGVIKFY